MTAWLRHRYGCRVNPKRVYRLLKQAKLQSRIRRKKRFFKPICEENKANNTLNREFTAQRPNEKGVTDITYLFVQGKFLYLSAIKDLYSKEIVAYQIRERNDLALVLDTWEQAIKKGGKRGSWFLVIKDFSISPLSTKTYFKNTKLSPYNCVK